MRVPIGLVLLLALSSCGDDDAPRALVRVDPQVPSQANVARAELVSYLERLAGEVPVTRGSAELGVSFQPRSEAGDGFELTTLDAGETTTVTIACGTALGCQYGAYELLRRLGSRFYHPEDEWVPRIPAEQLRARAKTPTAVGPDGTFVPDFRHRSFSFHGAHPLEHMESFGDARHPIAEAERVNRWIVKNRGDVMRGAGRSVAPEKDRQQRAAELEALADELGLRRGSGITLHNQQQGASADLDPSSEVPIEQQIDAHVKRIADSGATPYNFGIHFGPTELTTTPDRETVQWIDWAGEAAAKYLPGVPVEVNDHITGRQPMEHYDDLGCPSGTNDDGVIDYYDLVFHTDPRWAAKVHTVMFYPLEGPAPVYGQASFAHKLCLIQQAAAEDRPIVWFPEGSYWLSFDNAVPVYLPLYLWSRHRDIELLRPLLASRGGNVEDHRMFNSGHEWGYWQQDYAVGLWAWNADATMEDVLRELGDPLCPVDAWPASCAARDTLVAVMTEVMEHQRQDFLNAEDFRGRAGGLYWYFAGEDPADEIGAVSGLELRPVRLAFREVAGLNAADRQRFVDVDLAALTRIGAAYDAWVARLEGVRDGVPEAGRGWLEEVIDGLAMNAVRARHTGLLYDVTIQLADGQDATATLAAAAALVDEAEVIVTRREAGYRYPMEQMIGRGSNGTTYPFRVHTKTHELAYWTNRQEQVQDLVDGDDEAPTTLVVEPVFADPDTTATLTWPELPELTGLVDMGDGATVGVDAASHAYVGEGVWTVSGALEVSGAPLSVRGAVARASLRARTDKGDFELVEPDSEVARTVLGSLVPSFRVALTETMLAFVPEPGGFGTASFTAVATATLTRHAADEAHAEAWVTSSGFSFELPIPDPSSGRVAANVTVSGATLECFASARGEAVLAGELEVRDLVDTLVALAGFEPQGATETLAGVLGFDPNDPPDRVPFRALLTLGAE